MQRIESRATSESGLHDTSLRHDLRRLDRAPQKRWALVLLVLALSVQGTEVVGGDGKPHPQAGGAGVLPRLPRWAPTQSWSLKGPSGEGGPATCLLTVDSAHVTLHSSLEADKGGGAQRFAYQSRGGQLPDWVGPASGHNVAPRLGEAIRRIARGPGARVLVEADRSFSWDIVESLLLRIAMRPAQAESALLRVAMDSSDGEASDTDRSAQSPARGVQIDLPVQRLASPSRFAGRAVPVTHVLFAGARLEKLSANVIGEGAQELDLSSMDRVDADAFRGSAEVSRLSSLLAQGLTGVPEHVVVVQPSDGATLELALAEYGAVQTLAPKAHLLRFAPTVDVARIEDPDDGWEDTELVPD